MNIFLSALFVKCEFMVKSLFYDRVERVPTRDRHYLPTPAISMA